jgi:hypothetical protein
MMHGEPTIDEVREWLRLTDDIDDYALQQGLDAALTFQQTTLRFPIYTAANCNSPELISQPFYSDDLRLAAMLRCARYLARRNSPEGLVGFGDLGVVQVAMSDRDIGQLESPYLRVTVA